MIFGKPTTVKGIGDGVPAGVGGGVAHAVAIIMAARVGVGVAGVVPVEPGQGPPQNNGGVNKKSHKLPPVQCPEGSV